MHGELPFGVRLRHAMSFDDARGSLHEVHRVGDGDPQLRQWNFVTCTSNSVRGVHVHLRHTDHLAVVSGKFLFGLHDIRRDSPTFGCAALLDLDGARTRLLTIPPGVAHGFLCTEDGAQVYGMTHEWDPTDDLACRWDDRSLGFRLPAAAPIVSARDSAAGSLSQMTEDYARATQLVPA